MPRDRELGIRVVGHQVRSADGSTVIGEIEGVEASTNTVVLTPRIGVQRIVDAPPPPDETPDGRHTSGERWADLLGHCGLFAPEGRASAPSLHADQK